MRDFILKWNATWHFDFWYRKKHNIAFNSPEHRELNQVDQKLNYLEHMESERQLADFQQFEKDQEEFKKTGTWLKKRELPNEVSDELWDALGSAIDSQSV